MDYRYRVAKSRALELINMFPDAEGELPTRPPPRPKPINKPIVPKKKDINAPPETTREYLNRTVTEAVQMAVNELTKLRPAEPLKFLAEYLLKLNSEALAKSQFVDDIDLD
uniref:RIIa domain-containing protein n=1 Tax=Panagrellus redivivus TaxID=6233 RepID=A0A7E4VTL1_PANRE